MDQLVLILIIALISFINWLIQKSAELRERRKLERMQQRGEAPEELPESAREEVPEAPANPEESMRRLMEALGLPVDSEPPPVPVRREETVPESAVQTPPPVLRPPPIPRTEIPQTPVPAMPAVSRIAPAVREPAPTVTAPEAPRVRELLSTPASLRKAIILAEILGPPKAFKP
jgi:hypothetical protein